MKTMILVSAILIGCVEGAAAQHYLEYPAPTPFYPSPRSRPNGRVVIVPPYRRPFPVRIYTTPPTAPFYNVPPYAVVAPY